MIRIDTTSGWQLVTHPDHARLAGQIAEAWGNERFARPDPFDPILAAVRRHDDGWIARDAAPFLTPDGRPEAFTRKLVGAYAAFEEIDLPRYLEVRGAATEAVARDNPLAGVLVSMHTVNLLTEQADLESIRPEHREIHRAFVDGQRRWQQKTADTLNLSAGMLRRGFEFLQACDNLSLILCADYHEAIPLRHTHPDREGVRRTLQCRGIVGGVWQIDPWPFVADEIALELPCRDVDRAACGNLTAYREAFTSAPIRTKKIVLKRA